MGAPDDRRERPSSSFGWLLMGEQSKPETHWQIADPHDAETNEAMRRLRYGWGTQLTEEQRRDVYRVLGMAEAWSHFSTYELGVEHVLKKLRLVWQALRSIYG